MLEDTRQTRGYKTDTSRSVYNSRSASKTSKHDLSVINENSSSDKSYEKKGAMNMKIISIEDP
jgi:hypothetical protein